MLTGYVGTYTAGNSEGIYRFSLHEQTGQLGDLILFKEVENAKYLAFIDNKLFALYDQGDQSGVLVLDTNGDVIASCLYEGVTACHIAVQGNFVYTSNYHSGVITKLELKGNDLRVVKQLSVQRKAGCHQVIFYKDYLIVPCLFLDKLLVLNQDLEIISEIELPKGSGPRHGVISTDDTRLYLVSELSNELFTYQIEELQFKLIQQLSILPNDETNKEGTAALRISRNGRKLYVSTRGANIITVVDIGVEMPKILQFESAGGNHPRDILDVANDSYLLVANRFSNELLSYRLNDGRIGVVSSKLAVPEGVSIVMEGDLND